VQNAILKCLGPTTVKLAFILMNAKLQLLTIQRSELTDQLQFYN